MRTSSAQLKLWARRALSGKYGIAIGAQAAMYVITMGVTIAMEFILMFGSFMVLLIDENAMSVFMGVIFVVVYLVILILEMMMTPGLVKLYMNICTNKKAAVGDIFFAFKNRPGKFVLITVALSLIAVALVVPVFLLIFATGLAEGNPGFLFAFTCIYWVLVGAAMIYVSLTYGMFYFVIVENPEKGILEALNESRQLMIGNRFRFFCLGFSFLGMILLGYMSLGAGFIWLMPYITCTSIFFYLDLKPAVEVYSPQWQENMQPDQWERRPEPPVGPGPAGVPGQPPMGSGPAGIPGQPPMGPGPAGMPGQPPVTPGPVWRQPEPPAGPEHQEMPQPPQPPVQPDGRDDEWESQNW